MTSFIIWPVRVVLYVAAAWVGLWIIFPAVGGGLLGIALSAPTASIALGIDVFISSKLRKESVEQDVARRLVVLDRVLSSEPAEKHQSLPEATEVEVEEILPPSTDYDHQLPGGPPRF